MGKNFGIILAVVCGAAVVIVGVLVLSLYTIPNMNFFGAQAVYIRNQYTNYWGPEIEQIFDASRRNIIIDSERTSVYVRVRSMGQGDENTITIFEDANGISFNSVNRTHLNITQEYTEDDEIYTRIKVIEPAGAVARTARVHINLKDGDITPYNFIMANRSSVTFVHDESVNEMYIGRLVINGSGHVSLPIDSSDNVFNMTVGELEVNAPNASIRCDYDILGDVTVTRTSRSVNLANIGGELSVKGSLSHIVDADFVRGNVTFDCPAGRLTFDDTEGNLYVVTETAEIRARTVSYLSVENLTGNVSVRAVNGDADIYMLTGSLELGGRSSTQGVLGDVRINPDKTKPKRGGATTVYFANGSFGDIICYSVNGDVNVFNARGSVKLYVAAYGVADVNVEFAGFLPDPPSGRVDRTIIVYGSRESRGSGGNISVTLKDKSLAFDLCIEDTYERENRLDNITNLYNANVDDQGVDFELEAIPFNGGGPLVHVMTHSRFVLA